MTLLEWLGIGLLLAAAMSFVWFVTGKTDEAARDEEPTLTTRGKD